MFRTVRIIQRNRAKDVYRCVCVCVCVEREIYFKESPDSCGAMVNPKSAGQAGGLETQGKNCSSSSKITDWQNFFLLKRGQSMLN